MAEKKDGDKNAGKDDDGGLPGEVQLTWARIVARAATDPIFARLLDEGVVEAFRIFGITDVEGIDPEADLIPSLSNARQMIASAAPESGAGQAPGGTMASGACMTTNACSTYGASAMGLQGAQGTQNKTTDRTEDASMQGNYCMIPCVGTGGTSASGGATYPRAAPVSGDCVGSIGTAGSVGSVGGCAGSLATAGTYGCAGVQMQMAAVRRMPQAVMSPISSTRLSGATLGSFATYCGCMADAPADPVSGDCWGSAGSFGSAGTFGGCAGSVGTAGSYGCAVQAMH